MKDSRRQVHAVLVIGVLLLEALNTPRAASAQQPNRAGLVIDFGDGAVATRCVEFAEPAISGYDILRQSGLRVVADETSGMGVTVCDIGNTSGCSASDCFCQCQGTSCTYWTYYHLDEGAWSYSPLGASASTVEHGDVEGWVWGPGNPQGGALPPVVEFDEICGSTNGAAGSAATATRPADATSTTRPEPSTTPTSTPTEPPVPSRSPTPGGNTGAPQSPSPSTVPAAGSPAAKLTAMVSSTPSKTKAPTPSPSSTVDPHDSETTAPEEAPEDSARPVLPVSWGYLAFGVITVGLLGWLLYILRSHGTRA